MNQAVVTVKKSNITSIASIVMETVMVFVFVLFITAPKLETTYTPIYGDMKMIF